MQTAAVLPQFASIKTMLYMEKSKTLPEIPKSRDSLDVTGRWAKTMDDQEFLLINDGTTEKIVVSIV
jgi:hypothetical protein